MIIDHNYLALNSHHEQVSAIKIRAASISLAALKSPALVASMYVAFPHLVHEIPLGQVAQVAEDLCDAGFHSVITDMSENRAIRKEYRQVLEGVALGEAIVI